MEVRKGENRKEVLIGDMSVYLDEDIESVVAKVEEYFGDDWFVQNGVLGIKGATCFGKEGTIFLPFNQGLLGAVKVDLYDYDARSTVQELNEKMKELYGKPEYSIYDIQNMYDAKNIIIGIVRVSMGEVVQILFTRRVSDTE